MADTELHTLPELAKQYGVSLRQAAHAADVYNVEPVMRIAGARVYDRAGAEHLQSALRRTGALAQPMRLSRSGESK